MAQKKETNTGRLIAAGARLLADQTPLNQQVPMHRNGQRGILHTTEGCSSFPWRGARSTVRLTLKEIAEKSHCDNCSDRLLDHNIRLVLQSVLRVENLLERVARPESTSTVARTGEAIGLVKEAQERLDGLTSEQKDLLIPAYLPELSEKVRDASARFADTGEDAEQQLLTWAASALCRDLAGRRQIPGALDGDYDVFGEDPRLMAGESRIVAIHLWWTRTRGDGQQAAAAKVRSIVEAAEINSLDELRFPATGTLDGQDMLTWVNSAWRKELIERLETRLLPAWEEKWQEFTVMTGRRIVAIPTAVRKDQSHAILTAFTPVKVVNAPEASLVEVPEAIGRWLVRHEPLWGNWGGVIDVASPKPGLVDIVAALWEPRDANAPYHTLSAAVVAAESL